MTVVRCLGACDGAVDRGVAGCGQNNWELPFKRRDYLRYGRAVRDVRRSDDSGANRASSVRVRRSEGWRRAQLL